MRTKDWRKTNAVASRFWDRSPGIGDNDLRQCALLRQGRTAIAPRFYEIKERDLTLCACQLKGKQFWRSAIEVKDERLPLSIKTEYGLEMAYNATAWTEKSNPSWHARFGLVGAAAMHDLHVIQGPNVTRDARETIAFFAFHAFVVADSRFQQSRVRTKLYNCGACVCKSNAEIRIAGDKRRHTDPNGGYDQNEIKRNKALNYFKQSCPIFRFAIQTFLRDWVEKEICEKKTVPLQLKI